MTSKSLHLFSMKIGEITDFLESVAPLSLQEDYDNAGLLVGRRDTEVNAVLISLDCIESTVYEAMERNCQLVIAHHPIIFSGIKRFNGQDYIQRTVEMAIRHGIAIYAIHTNLDNVLHKGVNSRIADRLGLTDVSILQSKTGGLVKLATYVPRDDSQKVLNALFAAGAGHIGNYSACSFSTDGYGTFKGNDKSNPHKGEAGMEHTENEQRIEVVLRDYQRDHIHQCFDKGSSL